MVACASLSVALLNFSRLRLQDFGTDVLSISSYSLFVLWRCTWLEQSCHGADYFSYMRMSLSSISSTLDAFWLVWSFSCYRFPLVVLGWSFLSCSLLVLRVPVSTWIRSLCVRSSAFTFGAFASSSFVFCWNLLFAPWYWIDNCYFSGAASCGRVWRLVCHGRLPKVPFISSWWTWMQRLTSCGCSARGLVTRELGFSKVGRPLASLCPASFCMIF